MSKKKVSLVLCSKFSVWIIWTDKSVFEKVWIAGVEKKLWVSEIDLSKGASSYFDQENKTLSNAKARVKRGTYVHIFVWCVLHVSCLIITVGHYYCLLFSSYLHVTKCTQSSTKNICWIFKVVRKKKYPWPYTKKLVHGVWELKHASITWTTFCGLRRVSGTIRYSTYSRK